MREFQESEVRHYFVDGLFFIFNIREFLCLVLVCHEKHEEEGERRLVLG